MLSLLFKYVPGLSGWYEGVASEHKELIMLGLMVAVVGGAFALSCVGWLSVYECTEMGARDAVFALVGAVAGNQGAYSMLSYQKK